MTDEQTKALSGAVGLALKAGKCLTGTEACVEKMRNGQGSLLVMAGDCSPNTEKRLLDSAKSHGIPYLLSPMTKAAFAALAGKKSDTAAFLIMDDGFVKILEKSGAAIHKTNTEVL